MSGFSIDLQTQIMAEAPGAAMVGSNTRVKGQLGFLGTQLDLLTFANGATGQWTAPNTRVRIQGVFTVSQSSQGIAVVPSPTPHSVPITVITGDPRLSKSL
ncbi:MAG TPA: hypothetical protein VIV60_19880 [Polyangiaceae bacterium]